MFKMGFSFWSYPQPVIEEQIITITVNFSRIESISVDRSSSSFSQFEVNNISCIVSRVAKSDFTACKVAVACDCRN